jgi:tRNA/tmRNA/rRNA uracil-C5-methylase (TrmA/RlmC/RlmD family)
LSKLNNNGGIFEVKIERIVPNGFGIGFAEGLTFFVTLAASGDRLRVRVNQLKGKIAFAEIVEILEPSPDRVDPRCDYFGRCGGCDFQHLSIDAQLAAKVGIVRDCLRRIGKIEFGEIPIVPSPESYGYRSRAQWHADTNRREIGYFKRGSHDIIEIKTCPILTPALESALSEIRNEIDWASFWAERIEFEAASSGGQVSVFSNELLEPTVELDFCVGENRYFYDARSFFQGNQFLIENLTELAVGDLSGRVALDLYCGVGLFTLPLARRFEQVIGVESGELAVATAKKNIAHANLSNAQIVEDSVGRWLQANRDTIANVDFVVLDPPRSGTDKGTIESIVSIAPQTISYVSCEPSTLARDMRVLLDGGYAAESITALDLFPQTHHVETVVRLSKRT